MNIILKCSRILRLLIIATIFYCTVPSFAQHVPDYALETPVVNLNPTPRYGLDSLDYGMTIGVERTAKGRIWGAWVAGGDNEDAFFVLATSDNQGKAWSKPRMVIDPHSPEILEKRRALVGTLWLDPLNRLWLFFDQALTYFDGRAGNWYTICENPDADNPTWSTPKRIWHGATLNKPIILKDNTWVLPVSLWDRKKIKADFFKTSYKELDSLRGAHVFTSVDSGRTWTRQGKVTFPSPQFDEHHIVELADGRLWMTARTAVGIYQSFSSDKGKTWTKYEFYMPHIGSRHYIRRLKSGKLLLIKHGELNERTRTRSKLYAYLSDDDGKSWYGKLSIDERRGISYPDGFEDPKGNIFISYDRNRDTDGQILMVKFTEKDILNQRIIKNKERLTIAQPQGLDKVR